MSEPRELVQLGAARRALAEAQTIDEIKDIMDKAEALRLYAKKAKKGLEAQNQCADIKIQAEMKAGALLKEMELNNGGRPQNPSHAARGLDVPTIADLGLSYSQSSRWQLAAELPEEAYEQYKAECAETEQELTSAGVRRKAQALRRPEPPETPPMDGKYRVLYADPPWAYNDSGVITDSDNYGRAKRHYTTMSIDELCQLGEQVKGITEENAVLFLWATSPLLEDAFKVINAWGFKYKTSFVWDKIRHNFGHYNSVRHEFLLVCTRGSCTPDNLKLFDSVQSIERSNTHSEKPAEFRTIIGTLYPHGNRIELFARKPAEGWAVWGNEVNEQAA